MMKRRVPFHGRVLMLGCGSVARCTLPLVIKHLEVPCDRITVLDMADCRQHLETYMGQGLNFVQEQIVPERMAEQLGRYVGSGDLIIDLAWNIGCVDLLDWCHRQNVLYINTSVELWDPYSNAAELTPQERTLYVRHMEIRRLVESWGKRPGTTAVLEHGANPGLVSHFTKKALRDIAAELINRNPDDTRRAEIERLCDERGYPRLAQLLGVKVIHVSERDTQISEIRKRRTEFVNTWSVEGLYEEGTSPAEMGWGTHEQTLPVDGCTHSGGPENQICLRRFGIDTFVNSRVPSSDIIGMVIRHGEAFTISDKLTVWDDAGKAVYRPTVHYAYLPCPDAVQSLAEMRRREYKMPHSWRIMGNEIVSGVDELGVLLMGHDLKSWWTGTILDIAEARELVPGQNATTLQVAASVVSAVLWMIRNPQSGVRLPDDLPHEEILAFARPYLGEVVSQELDWVPPASRKEVASGKVAATADSVWQFNRFLTTPRKALVTPAAEPVVATEKRRPKARVAGSKQLTGTEG